MTLRNLVLVLGDQLDLEASGFDDFDVAQDAVWMAEVDDEASHVWSIQPRIAIFLAAMRHFAHALVEAGRTVHYTRLDGKGNRGSMAAELELAIRTHRPQGLVMTAPGEHRVLKALQAVAAAEGVPLEIREDRHFFCTVREFAAHARGRRQLRMEFFYREQRRRHDVLMDGDEPVGGQWNYDAENRASFGKAGPGLVPAAPAFGPDPLTQGVLDLVAERFADRPGKLANFAWPVTRAQALDALADFISHRLADFGHWQDAMWPGEPWLWHSRLSAAMNLKLLHPREVVEAVEKAYRAGHVPLASAEGFIRQILGWREYVRGIYWTRMPRYLELNALGAKEPLPGFYWTGDTPMACLADAIGQTLEHGYAHHIQRLMVTGLYALLLGVEPQQVHAWYLAVYVDAVEWVELPNTLGMSQFGDGGLMGSKPYVATGRYIERMSAGSLCGRCRFKPAERLGDEACPFTTLYWDFLARHEERLASNPRMTMQLRNLQRLDADERRSIAESLGRHPARRDRRLTHKTTALPHLSSHNNAVCPCPRPCSSPAPPASWAAISSAGCWRTAMPVIALSRDPARAGRTLGPQVRVVGQLSDIAADTPIDACIHLAGARVIGPPWTQSRREELMRSRAAPASQLLALMHRLARPPRALLVASAIGWYGKVQTGADLPCDESAPPQPGQFQSDLCAAIERDAQLAEALGVRVVRLRFGVVLGTDGGAYPPQALAARLGLGAVLGDGRQPSPWVHVDDVVGLACFALAQETMAGPVNVVAPPTPTQSEFVHALAASYGRKVRLRVPGVAVRLAMGEMSDLLLAGRNVVPAVAQQAGYAFIHPSLEAALAALAAESRRALAGAR